MLNANLKNAELVRATLENARYWKEEQLQRVRSLEAAIMPDGTKLKDVGDRYRKSCDGPTFEEWLAMQKGQVDEHALAEVDALIAAEQNFEEE